MNLKKLMLFGWQVMKIEKGKHCLAFKRSFKIRDSATKRIVFREITKDAVLNAISNPRKINQS